MALSGQGARLLRVLEGERLEPYRDAANVLTIGAGHTGEFPKHLQLKHHLPPAVESGMMITEEVAEDILAYDVARFEAMIREAVTVPLKQNEFDALVLLAFNIGGAFKTSTLLKLLNQGLRDDAADEFLKWRKAGGRVLSALEKRRAVEREIFLNARYDMTPYDGDLKDAVVPIKERHAEVDAPATEGRPDLSGSRTIDAGRKGVAASGLAGILSVVVAIKEAFGPQVFQAVPSWAIAGVVVVVIGYGTLQHGRAIAARMSDYFTRGR